MSFYVKKYLINTQRFSVHYTCATHYQFRFLELVDKQLSRKKKEKIRDKVGNQAFQDATDTCAFQDVTDTCDPKPATDKFDALYTDQNDKPSEQEWNLFGGAIACSMAEGNPVTQYG